MSVDFPNARRPREPTTDAPGGGQTSHVWQAGSSRKARVRALVT